MAPVPVRCSSGSVGSGLRCLLLVVLALRAGPVLSGARGVRATSGPLSASYLGHSASTVNATHRLGLTRRAGLLLLLVVVVVMLTCCGRLRVVDGHGSSSAVACGSSCAAVHLALCGLGRRLRKKEGVRLGVSGRGTKRSLARTLAPTCRRSKAGGAAVAKVRPDSLTRELALQSDQ